MNFLRIKRSTFLQLFILTVVLFGFFSYRLADTPKGINLDEASYGYNGVLLAHDLHDSQGRFLPIFILGSDSKTWYPPYMQYFVAFLFKLFGPSVYIMRLASVVVTVFSSLLILYFARLLFAKKYAFIALISFLLIPEVMIETHTPLEHMIVVPFVLLWLIGLFKFSRSFEKKYLILAALSLGIGFYSYGGIRPFVAVWILISTFYIIYLMWQGKTRLPDKKLLFPLLTFNLTVLPFLVLIPIFEYYYAGAVLNRVSFKIDSIYNFFYYYLASFDVSFLFIKGDKLLVQSTLRHGMFLLSTLPLFIIGIYHAFRNGSSYLTLLGVTFLATPLLYGFVGSAHFAHRLLYMVPFYIIFLTLGVKKLIENKNLWLKFISFILFILISINYFDFWRYYMFSYPNDTYNIFHHLENYDKSYKELYLQATNKKLQPFFSQKVAREEGVNITDPELFSRAIYFPKKPRVLGENESLPMDAILLSEKDNIAGLKRLEVDALPFYLFVN